MDSCLTFVSLFNEKRKKKIKNCWDLNIERQGKEASARLSELFSKDLLRAAFPHTVTDADLAHPEKREVIERAAKAQNAVKPKFWRQI